MNRRMRSAWVPALLVGLTTCSVKRITFEGEPTDAPPPDTAPGEIPIEDAGAPTQDTGASTQDDASPPALGTMENPALSCAALKQADMRSGVYWIQDPIGMGPPFRVYCEQDLEGGGWALLENSVRREDGSTTAFWRFGYDERLTERGTLSLDDNYYRGSLYIAGSDFMDVFVDLQDTTAVAAVMTGTGFDPVTMRFETSTLLKGNQLVYDNQFAAGWSARDYDGDLADDNCATFYSNIAQHYNRCWVYNLGADVGLQEETAPDGDIGPHVRGDVLESLTLAPQPDGGRYSQVNRISRFTRW